MSRDTSVKSVADVSLNRLLCSENDSETLVVFLELLIIVIYSDGSDSVIFGLLVFSSYADGSVSSSSSESVSDSDSEDSSKSISCSCISFYTFLTFIIRAI